MRLSLTLIVCLVVSLATAALGAVTIYREDTAISAIGGPSLLGELATAPEAGLPVGMSTLANKQSLDLCLVSLRSATSLQMRYLSEDARRAIPSYCAELSAKIIRRTPTSSYAWAVGALADLRAGDMDGFNQKLILSQSSGPAEQWVAGLRADLAFDNFAGLDQTALDANRKDIALLIQSVPGSHTLARHYLRQPDLRQHIEAVIETLPEVNQRRFVTVLRAAS